MGMTGQGGYGGISTMNQDDRGPRYGKHNPLSMFLEAGEMWHVKCLRCGESWQHLKGRRKFPKECKKI